MTRKRTDIDGKAPRTRKAGISRGGPAPAALEHSRRLDQAKEDAFVAAYLRTKSPAKAWKIAYDPRDNLQMSDEALTQRGETVLTLPRVVNLIDSKLAAATRTLEISAQRIIRDWWDIATASPADIVQIRLCNCRYCHGVGNQYRWTSEAEFVRAKLNYQFTYAHARGKRPAPPSDAGGFGFVFAERPNPACVHCGGQGHPQFWMKDTRELTDQERLLFDGVKMTKYGMEVKFRDRDAALLNIAKVLGYIQPEQAEKNDPGRVFEHNVAPSSLPTAPQDLARMYHDFIGAE